MKDKNKTPNKTALELAEEALRKFWLEKSKAPIIKAKHAELFVEPKIFVAGELNTEIGKLLIAEYLSKITIQDIAKGRVTITSDLIKIKDESGKLIAEVRSKKLINNMINKITNYLGRMLSEREGKEGTPYIEPSQNEPYTFGDIKEALIQFLMDMERNDSKNLVRDAIILLRKENGTHIQINKTPIKKENIQKEKTQKITHPETKKKI